MPYRAVFTTERGLRHQRSVVDAAPDLLEVTMLRAPDRETLRRHLADAVYWISERVGTVDADLIEPAPHLQLIQRLGSLWYDIDLQAAQRAGVAVCYWPVLGVIRVAEHAELQTLALAKKLREAETIALGASPRWAESRRTDEDTFAYNRSGRKEVRELWGQDGWHPRLRRGRCRAGSPAPRLGLPGALSQTASSARGGRPRPVHNLR